MHIGYANPKCEYSLLRADVEATDSMKDLGVVISSDPEFSNQWTEIQKKRIGRHSLEKFVYNSTQASATAFTHKGHQGPYPNLLLSLKVTLKSRL